MTSTNFSHRHSLDYTHGVSSGWANVTDLYGTERGVCRDCGQRIAKLIEAGKCSVEQVRPYRTVAESVAIEDAHAEAIAEDAERRADDIADAIVDYVRAREDRDFSASQLARAAKCATHEAHAVLRRLLADSYVMPAGRGGAWMRYRARRAGEPLSTYAV